MTTQGIPTLVGTPEVAHRLKVHAATVARMVNDGRIVPLGKLPRRNGALVFSPEEVDRVAADFAASAAERSACGHEVSDGNRDDPSFAYCGLPQGHAGAHGAWRT